MKPIENQPIKKDKYAPIHIDQISKEYSLDFLYSDNLEEIENGIKQAYLGVEASILVIALAIVKIEREALYIQAGYTSLTDYLNNSELRLKMPKQTVTTYKRIGEAYLKYKNELQKYGFIETGNLNKLRYLEAALEKHEDKNAVFKMLNTATFREFLEFAKAEPQQEKYIPRTEINGSDILIDGVKAISIPETLDENLRQEIQNLIIEFFRIKKSGNIPYLVETYDKGEQNAINNFLKRYRSKK